MPPKYKRMSPPREAPKKPSTPRGIRPSGGKSPYTPKEGGSTPLGRPKKSSFGKPRKVNPSSRTTRRR